MFAEERRKQILIRLARDGQLLSADLIKEFAVSEDTIRRDLKDLADAGLLKKVHGGAMATTTVPYEYGARQSLNIAAKAAIAQRAVSLIRERMLIFIDGATTSAQIAAHIPPSLSVTFVTYSLATATALTVLPRAEIILLGGTIVPDLLITMGPELGEQAKRFMPDLAVVGVHGLTPAKGGTVESYEDALAKRKFIENSAEVAVLAGHEKLGFVASFFVIGINEISYLISDADSDRLKPYSEAGITVLPV